MKTLVVDIDGTLTCSLPSSPYSDTILLSLEPDLSIIEKLRQLWKAGHDIIIFTSRPCWNFHVTKKWLIKHKVPHSRLIMGKPMGDVYIDDLSIRPDEMEKLMEDKNDR